MKKVLLIAAVCSLGVGASALARHNETYPGPAVPEYGWQQTQPYCTTGAACPGYVQPVYQGRTCYAQGELYSYVVRQDQNGTARVDVYDLPGGAYNRWGGSAGKILGNGTVSAPWGAWGKHPVHGSVNGMYLEFLDGGNGVRIWHSDAAPGSYPQAYVDCHCE
jgi:hypothetical protein